MWFSFFLSREGGVSENSKVVWVRRLFGKLLDICMERVLEECEALGEVGEQGTLRDKHLCRRRLRGMVKRLTRKR